MRIAIEGSTWVNLRGYGRFTREITRALLARPGGHEFTLVLDSGARRADDLPDVPVLEINTRRAVTQAAAANGARSVADVWRMSRALSSRRFDVVVFPTMYSFVPVTGGARVLVVIHDALPETLPRLVLGSRRAELFWRAKGWLALRRANALATVSHASADAIRAHMRVGDRPIAVLTEGVAPVFSPSVREGDERLVQHHVRAGARFVLYVGGLSRHKRVPELIASFGQLLRSRAAEDDLMLVLAGPADEDRFETDRQNVALAIAALGADAARVITTGYVTDETLAAFYRSAVCVVLPSAAEGFGLPALESMASGCPLLVAHSPALAEVCGDAAEYFHDLATLTEQLERLIADDGRRARLRGAGLERALGFSWDTAARRLLEALEGREP